MRLVINLTPLIPLFLVKERGKDIKKRDFAPLKLPLKNNPGFPSKGKIRTFLNFTTIAGLSYPNKGTQARLAGTDLVLVQTL